MKNLLLLPAMFLGLMITTHAQKSNEPTFTSNEVIFEKESHIITYIGNVNAKNETFEIINAQKITYDLRKRTLIATHCEKFSITGSIKVVDPAKKNSVVKYTIGETVAYIK